MAEAKQARILIADDEPLFRRTTAELLRKAGYDCTCAADGREALEALSRERFDLVLSDLNMPGNLKLELLREGRDKWPNVPLIVVTGAPSLPSAIESVRLGISDYLLKPVKYEDLLASVRRALRSRDRAAGARAPIAADDPYPDIVGESPPIRELREIIDRVAETDANVLITGESGTGKEVIARAIHRRSRRADGALQVIDCTAIPEALFESIVFGHAKGAFTGAVKDSPGLLSQADGGTAFFDEIGELPAPLQAKLLRVIQEQTFTPVGKTTEERVDARFISATNRDLELEVNAGRFRRDLFYRLAVIHIEAPPLRERGDDVLLLADHFLELLQPDADEKKKLSPEAAALLKRYSWPGNIRELRNAIERGIALARGPLIMPADLPAPIQQLQAEQGSAAAETNGNRSSRTEVVQDAERDYLIDLLRANAGNVAQSARQAGMSRQGLHKLLKRHGVDPAQFRQ